MKNKVTIKFDTLYVECTEEQQQYYLGRIDVYALGRLHTNYVTSLHIEVIPVVKRRTGNFETRNPSYQARLDAWYDLNPGAGDPEFLNIPGPGLCFIHIDPFAK